MGGKLKFGVRVCRNFAGWPSVEAADPAGPAARVKPGFILFVKEALYPVGYGGALSFTVG